MQLMLLGHRSYSPKLGRFLTQNPIAHEGGLNLYACCGNNLQLIRFGLHSSLAPP